MKSGFDIISNIINWVRANHIGYRDKETEIRRSMAIDAIKQIQEKVFESGINITEEEIEEEIKTSRNERNREILNYMISQTPKDVYYKIGADYTDLVNTSLEGVISATDSEWYKEANANWNTGTEIRVQRQKRGWTYKVLAEKIGLSEQKIKDLEAHHIEPDELIAQKLSDVFNINYVRFLARQSDSGNG